MLNPDLQDCQMKLPWVTSVDVCVLNHPLRMWGRILWHSKKCLATNLIINCFRRCLNRAADPVFFLDANAHTFVPPFSWGGLRVQEFGLKRMKMWNISALQRVNCGLHWQPLRFLCLLQADSGNLGVVCHAMVGMRPPSEVLKSVWAFCHMGIPLPICAQFAKRTLQFLKTAKWFHSLASLPAKSSSR